MYNVIFDIGNVIVNWQPYHALSHLFSSKEEMNETLQRIGFFEWNIEQDRGRSWPEALAHIENTLPDYAHIFHAYSDGIEAAHSGIVTGTSQIIEELHNNGIALYGLTNAALNSFEHMSKTAPKLSLLRHITVSAEIGMVKPEPEIFEFCISHNNLDRTQTLFVDDSIVNCKGAANIGINSHHFTTADILRSDLEKLGLL